MNDGPGATFWIIFLAIMVFYIYVMWRIYEKADKPGWAAIVPIYNIYVLLQIVGRPGWWLLLFFIPIVNIIVSVIVYIELAHSFGKSTAFGIGLILLGLIFLPILALGDAQYQGPVAS
jgi:uncharacterized membrane protein YhaH (DUF805 family)